jgi:O-antigen/teichoic acid export membrane protein
MGVGGGGFAGASRGSRTSVKRGRPTLPYGRGSDWVRALHVILQSCRPGCRVPSLPSERKIRVPLEKSGSLTSHVSWLLFAKALSFVFTLALPMVLVRRLNQAEFGIYKEIFLIIGSIVVLLPLGFGMSAYYFLPREPEHQQETVVNVFLFNLTIGTLAGAVFFFHPSLLGDIFRQPGLAVYSRLVGLVMLLWIVSAFLEVAPIANQEIKLASAAIVSVQLSRTAFYLAAVLLFGTVRALVYAAVLQGFLQTAILLAYLQSRFPGFWRCFDPSMMRRQLSYALPLGFGGLLYRLQNDLHNYFVSNWFGQTVYAVYAIGTMNLPFMSLLQEATNSVMILRVTVLQQRNETVEILRLTARAMRKLAAIYFPAFVLLLILRREFITFLFTARYAASANIFAVNLLLLPMAVLLYDPLFRAFMEQRFFLLRIRMVLCVLMAGALWFAIRHFGLMGAISVVVLTTATERVLTLIRVCSVLGARWSDIRLLKDVGKIALASALAGGVAEAARATIVTLKPIFILAAGGAAFTLVYAAAVLAFRIVTPEEKELIRAKFESLRRRSAEAV